MAIGAGPTSRGTLIKTSAFLSTFSQDRGLVRADTLPMTPATQMMAGAMFLWLAIPPRYPTGQFLWLGLLFMGVFALGMSVLVVLDRWRKRPEPRSSGASEQLADFESLYAQGEISQKEYERIKLALSKQLRHEVAGPQPRTGEPSGQTPPAQVPPNQPDAPA